MKRALLALLTATLAVAQPVPGPAPAPAGIISGVGNFSHIVNDLEKSFAFYRDVIGLEVAQAPAQFAANAAIQDLGNTPGAESRIATFRIPNSALGVELIEYRGIARTPVTPRFQDPGAATLVLRVWDVAPILAKLPNTGARILSLNGPPDCSGPICTVFLQDPDGFFIELSRESKSDPAAAPNVHGGNFEIIVEDTDTTLKFWRDVLHFEMGVTTTFDGNADLLATVGINTPGAQFKRAVMRIPGTTVGMYTLEFRNLERRKLNTKTQDPGTPILQLRAPDVDAVVDAWKKAGGEVVSKGGVPATMGATKLVLLRDPNGVMIEVLPAPRPQPTQ